MLNPSATICCLQALGDGPYQHNNGRPLHWDRIARKVVETRVGPLAHLAPQIRDVESYLFGSVRKAYVEQALKPPVAVVCVWGVSKRSGAEFRAQISNKGATWRGTGPCAELRGRQRTLWRFNPSQQDIRKLHWVAALPPETGRASTPQGRS